MKLLPISPSPHLLLVISTFIHYALFFFFLMIRRPPRSTLFSLHDALPISHELRSRRGVTRHCRPVQQQHWQGGIRDSSVTGVQTCALDRKSTRLNSSHT